MRKLLLVPTLLSLAAAVAAIPLSNTAPSRIALAAANSPYCGSYVWCNWQMPPGQRARLMLAALTPSEKFSLLAGVSAGVHTGEVPGIPAVGLNPYYMTDGTQGVRQGCASGSNSNCEPATYVPAEEAIAASWDPGVAQEIGSVMGAEARDRGNDMLLAPGLTLVRTPLTGRAFQYPGEDPVLAADIGLGYAQGIQAQGEAANAQDFIANNQEGRPPPTLDNTLPTVGFGTNNDRFWTDANVSEQTLQELYYPPFETAVTQGDVASIMCALNSVNGTANCMNHDTLITALRDEWHFKGVVLSDWEGTVVHPNPVGYIQNGLDLEMPLAVNYTPQLLQAALDAGLITWAQVDQHVYNYLRMLFATGFMDRPPYVDATASIPIAADAQVALNAEEQAITLMKNSGNLLPLNPAKIHSIAVIGQPADTVIMGDGSSQVTPFPTETSTVLSGITQLASQHGVSVAYDDGTNLATAQAAAHAADVAVVVVADSLAEGADRRCLSLECPDTYGNQDALVSAVAAANPHTVVVMETGDADLTPWRNSVSAILDAYYPGEQGGTAVARVLFGYVDPSGHLPLTFPQSESQIVGYGNPWQYPGVGTEEYYSEGTLIGYRWFDAHHFTPAFPFGMGLSYTTFAYQDLRLDRASHSSGAVAEVSFRVTNTGERAGAAVPQLYLGLPSLPADVQPPLALKRFSKVFLLPGKSATVTFDLTPQDLAYWQTSESKWSVAPGCYSVGVGSSSADLPLAGTIAIASKACGSAALRIGTAPAVPPPPQAPSPAPSPPPSPTPSPTSSPSPSGSGGSTGQVTQPGQVIGWWRLDQLSTGPGGSYFPDLLGPGAPQLYVTQVGQGGSLTVVPDHPSVPADPSLAGSANFSPVVSPTTVQGVNVGTVWSAYVAGKFLMSTPVQIPSDLPITIDMYYRMPQSVATNATENMGLVMLSGDDFQHTPEYIQLVTKNIFWDNDLAGGSALPVVTPDPALSGAWVEYTEVYNPTGPAGPELECYLNGELVAVRPDVAPDTGMSSVISIGGQQPNSANALLLAGNIAEVKITAAALAPAQFLGRYSNPVPNPALPPGASVPEAKLAAGLPLLGFALSALLLVRRRRRSAVPRPIG